MSDNWGRSGGCGLARSRGQAAKRKAPRVVLGGGPQFSARVAEQFRRLGWEVCTAAAEDLQTLAIRKNPVAVLLPADAGAESGFLTCAKLHAVRPKLRVVLVGNPTPAAERLAGFVGAAFATEETAADVAAKLVV